MSTQQTRETMPAEARKPAFRPPEGACDAHCHVFGPAAVFPYASDRRYTPQDAPKEALAALHRRLGIGRAVIVQASSASLLAARPLAPGWFNTTICCPIRDTSLSATTRVVVSARPPGPNGTTIRIGLCGSTPEQIGQRLEDDTRRWTRVVEEAGIPRN
jgi:hypothetical protein